MGTLTLGILMMLATPMPLPGDGGGADLVVDTDSIIGAGEWFNYNSFTIDAGVTVTVGGPDARVVIRARNITINGIIMADGAGAIGGPAATAGTAGGGGGGGAGSSNPAGADGGGGGGYGGAGGDGGDGADLDAVGATAGAAGAIGAAPVFAGPGNTPAAPWPRGSLASGGGGGGGGDGLVAGSGGAGGAGGGSIFLLAFEALLVDGTITADGAAGTAGVGADGGGGGGGAGGGIVLAARNVTIGTADSVTATGGAGGVAGPDSLVPGGPAGGGGGGGGRILILSDNTPGIPATFSVAGGAGGAGSIDGGAPSAGASGTGGVIGVLTENFQPFTPVNGEVTASAGFSAVTVGGESFTNDTTPILNASGAFPFTDRNGLSADAALRTHTASRWLVRFAAGPVNDYDPAVHDSAVSADLVSHEVATVLAEGRYFWVCAFRDDGAAAAADALGAYANLFSRDYPSTRTGAVPGSADTTRIRDFSLETPFSVDLTGPPAPDLVAPADGALVTAADLFWTGTTDPLLADGNAGSGTAAYDVEIAADSGFVSIQFSGSVGGTPPPATVSVAGLPSGVHFWRVRARDTAGNVSAFSAARAFSTPGKNGGSRGGGSGGCLASDGFALRTRREAPLALVILLMAIAASFPRRRRVPH